MHYFEEILGARGPGSLDPLVSAPLISCCCIICCPQGYVELNAQHALHLIRWNRPWFRLDETFSLPAPPTYTKPPSCQAKKANVGPPLPCHPCPLSIFATPMHMPPPPPRRTWFRLDETFAFLPPTPPACHPPPPVKSQIKMSPPPLPQCTAMVAVKYISWLFSLCSNGMGPAIL